MDNNLCVLAWVLAWALWASAGCTLVLDHFVAALTMGNLFRVSCECELDSGCERSHMLVGMGRFMQSEVFLDLPHKAGN